MDMNILSFIVSVIGLFFAVLVAIVGVTATFYKSKQELIAWKQEILKELKTEMHKHAECIGKKLDVLVSHQEDKIAEERMMKMLNIRSIANVRPEFVGMLIKEQDSEMEKKVKSQAIETIITNIADNLSKQMSVS